LLPETIAAVLQTLLMVAANQMTATLIFMETLQGNE